MKDLKLKKEIQKMHHILDLVTDLNREKVQLQLALFVNKKYKRKKLLNLDMKIKIINKTLVDNKCYQIELNKYITDIN